MTQALAERAEPTFFLALFSVSIAAPDRHPGGHRLGGMARAGIVDQVVSGLAMLAANVPSFWLGLILIQIFAVRLGWFPVAGYGDPGAPLARTRRIIWCFPRPCSASSIRR